MLFPTIYSLFCYESLLLFVYRKKCIIEISQKENCSICNHLSRKKKGRREMSDDEDIKSVSSLLSATP